MRGAFFPVKKAGRSRYFFFCTGKVIIEDVSKKGMMIMFGFLKYAGEPP